MNPLLAHTLHHILLSTILGLSLALLQGKVSYKSNSEIMREVKENLMEGGKGLKEIFLSNILDTHHNFLLYFLF